MDSSQWAAVAATASAIPAAVALVALLSAQRAERKRREPHLVGVAFTPEDLLDPSTMKITNIGGGAAVRAGVAGLHRGQQYALPVERVWTARVCLDNDGRAAPNTFRAAIARAVALCRGCHRLRDARGNHPFPSFDL